MKYVVFTGENVSKCSLREILLLIIPQEMFNKETETFFNTPLVINSIIDAELIIDSIFQEESVILLLDIEGKTLYIRKGPESMDVKKHYLPIIHFLCRSYLKKDIEIDYLQDESPRILQCPQMNWNSRAGWVFSTCFKKNLLEIQGDFFRNFFAS